MDSNYQQAFVIHSRPYKETSLIVTFLSENNGKINLITDGDIRRHSNNLFKKKITEVCTKNPNWISETATALSAIEKMNTL